MSIEKKRLKKDLPFGEFDFVSKGTIINFDGEKYFIDKDFSSDGVYIFEKAESQILKKIWNNPIWFFANLNHINIIVNSNKIILELENEGIDINDIKNLAKAIDYYFHSILGKENNDWDKLAGFTTKIKHSY